MSESLQSQMQQEAAAQMRMTVSAEEVSALFPVAMARVYLWMFMGLFVTAVVSLIVFNVPALFRLVFASQLVFVGLLIGEVLMVIAITRAINRLAPPVALGLFFLYAAVNGLTLSVIFFIYDLGSIMLAFGTAGALFGLMSFIGFTTKQDLTSYGKLLLMGLVGFIIASVVNIFLASTVLDWIITYAGIALFLGLTAYDTQRIKTTLVYGLATGQDAVVSRVGILGALRLYLDFINLFLLILRLLGRRR